MRLPGLLGWGIAMKMGIGTSLLALLVLSAAAQGQQPKDAPPSPAAPVAPGSVAPLTALPSPAPVMDNGDGSWFGPAGGNPTCGSERRVWVSAEYLVWWMKADKPPALVTTSPAGTGMATAGVPDRSSTQILFGDKAYNDDTRSGGRFGLGFWFDQEQTIGFEANYLILEGLATHFSRGSTGNPILARPFFDTSQGIPTVGFVAFPGLVTGSVTASDTCSNLTGIEALFRENLWRGPDYHVDVLGGYRFLRFGESLAISDSDVVTGANTANLPVGTAIVSRDQFDTRNEFNGFECGVNGEWRRGPLTANLMIKSAIGYNQGLVNTYGATLITEPGATPKSFKGGLLALPSNIGRNSRDDAIVIPEFALTLGYQATDHIRLSAGYTFLYWADTVRPGKQVDLVIDSTQVPPSTSTTATSPMATLGAKDTWIQGLSFAVEVRY